jgi:hypothetical protein
MQYNRFLNDRRIETADYWHVRSQETRFRAEQMINPESRDLMSGLADDYERTAHIVEGMASIRSALTSVMASVNALLSQQIAAQRHPPDTQAASVANPATTA